MNIVSRLALLCAESYVLSGQVRMTIGFHLLACDAVAWLVVAFAWARINSAGQRYGMFADLAAYWGLAVLPAAFVGWVLEHHARMTWLAQEQ